MGSPAHLTIAMQALPIGWQAGVFLRRIGAARMPVRAAHRQLEVVLEWCTGPTEETRDLDPSKELDQGRMLRWRVARHLPACTQSSGVHSILTPVRIVDRANVQICLPLS